MRQCFVLFCVTALVVTAPGQQGFYFTELRGLDDASGNTHLFYRTLFERTDPFYSSNHVYHWDLSQNVDTLFLADFFQEEFYIESVADYEFRHHDPAQYIAGGYISELDPVPVIWLPDTGKVFVRGCCGAIVNIELSRQDAQIVYADNAGNLMRSTDGGVHWEYVGDSTAYVTELLAVSPFDDRIIFALRHQINFADLVKSTDGGASYHTVATPLQLLSLGGRLFFAADSLHIWALAANFRVLWRSEDAGETWEILREDSLEMRVAIDTAAGDALYLSRGSEILRSDDYGTTFAPVATLNRPVIDLYKKPASERLYAATQFAIYEITPQDTVAIKSLPVVGIPAADPPAPSEFVLRQNYPNPFNPTTTIGFYLPVSRQVTLTVFTPTGQRVATLVRRQLPAGAHEVHFSASHLPSGVYFYQLRIAGGATLTRKMLLLK